MSRFFRTTLLVIVVFCIQASNLFAQPEADSLEDLRALVEERRYEEAREFGQQLLIESEEDPALSAAILDEIVSAARRAGDAAAPETQEMARRAISLKKRAYGEEHPEVAKSLHRYALVLAAAGDLEAAREQQEQALAMRERTLPANHVDIAQSLNSLGDIYRRLGRYKEAAPYFERALEIREAAQGPNHPEVARVLQNMGNNYLRSGDYTAARSAYERALAIKEETLGPNDSSLAYTLISMGVLYRTTGDFGASRAAYERALSICLESLGPEHPLTLAVNNNLANLMNETGDYAAAIPLYERTLKSRVTKLGPEHPQVAETHHNLAVVQIRTGDYESAVMNLAMSLAIWESSLGSDHPKLAHSLESLANVEMLRGDFDTALPLYERALAIRELKLGPSHPETANAHLALAAALLEMGDRGDALQHTRTADEILDRHLRETVAYLPERQAMAMAAAQRRPESVLFAGLRSAESDREAWAEATWSWTLRHRGLVQEELARRNRTVLTEESSEARNAWLELATAREELGQLWVEGAGENLEVFQASLTQARLRKENAEAQLARVSVGFEQELVLDALGMDELRDSLPTASALVEIVRVKLTAPTHAEKPWQDFALILRPDGTTQCVDLGSSDLVDARTEAWRSVLSGIEDDVTQLWGLQESQEQIEQAGQELRATIWDPIAAALGKASSVYLVPDAAYHLVDLAALPQEDGAYLIEGGHRIHLLDTGRDLARFSSDESTGRKDSGILLALGDIDFDADPDSEMEPVRNDVGASVFRGSASSCASFASSHWSPLPETRQELEEIQSLVGRDREMRLLMGSTASEAQFKQEAPNASSLHLATHGFFLEKDCSDQTEAENPLLLSGLVLAGANRAAEHTQGDDGILTAEELSALDLHGVELAVLSACDTGRGTVKLGEGVFGLRRAFSIAGTSTVVMSLWPLPDDAARAWMAHFYGKIAEGMPVSSAVQAASLARLRELREQDLPTHPRNWAGFISTGDWR